ncbi:MAG: toxin-antitoxin system HicB family antitoxin, partial [Desulfosalsimonas sp.]
LGADLHRQAALRAKQNGISINQLIVSAVENFLDLVEKEPSIHLHTHEHKYESKVPDWGIEISKGVSEWEITEALKH